MHSVYALLAFATNEHTTTPTLPLGWLVMWWLCARRKQEPIGGWLAYYYYQLYVGVLFSIAMVAALNIHSYVPENFTGESTRFYLFLLSALPALLLMLFEVAVATFLLALRTWDLVQLLRRVLIASALAELIGLVVDAKYFPDNIALGMLSFVPHVLWIGYFYKSDRVRRVFQTHDWQPIPKAAIA
jgi:hypothetical protein